ncbi:hypothetical protein FRC10_000386 [Ceratobasidium sp. 414]|nr:hypothetical protein FRC10_000386 [Ceratobasidium sp. 414]
MEIGIGAVGIVSGPKAEQELRTRLGLPSRDQNDRTKYWTSVVEAGAKYNQEFAVWDHGETDAIEGLFNPKLQDAFTNSLESPEGEARMKEFADYAAKPQNAETIQKGVVGIDKIFERDPEYRKQMYEWLNEAEKVAKKLHLQEFTGPF